MRSQPTFPKWRATVGTIAELLFEMISQRYKRGATLITSIIRGNLPMDDRADRDVSGWLKVNGQRFDIDQVVATEAAGFEISGGLDLVLRSERR